MEKTLQVTLIEPYINIFIRLQTGFINQDIALKIHIRTFKITSEIWTKSRSFHTNSSIIVMMSNKITWNVNNGSKKFSLTEGIISNQHSNSFPYRITYITDFNIMKNNDRDELDDQVIRQK